MAVSSPLLLCAAAVGFAQVFDCSLLLANRKMVGLTATVFSLGEWGWGLACAYLLIQKSDALPIWLSGSFVAYLIGWLIHMTLQARRGRSIESLELSRAEVLAGGVFGALYAIAAISVFSASAAV